MEFPAFFCRQNPKDRYLLTFQTMSRGNRFDCGERLTRKPVGKVPAES